MDHLAGKKTLKSLAELKSDLVKTNQHIAPKRREILQTFLWKRASSCPPTYKSLYKISGLCHGWRISSLALNISPLNKVSFKALSSSVVSMDNCLLKILEGSIKCKLHKRRKDKPVLGFVNISSHNSCFFLIRIENHYSYPKKVVYIDLQLVRFATLQKHKSVS